MTEERRAVAILDSRTYASVIGSPTEKISSVDRKMMMLRRILQGLLLGRQDGVPLIEARRSCPLLSDPDLLRNYPSVRQLLAAMPKDVCLIGVGVQTRLFPPAA